MLLRNITKLPQIIYSQSSVFPNAIHPNSVFSAKHYKITYHEPFEPFNLDDLHNQPVVTFIRTYALGDVIQLIPVVRKLKKFYNIGRVYILTPENYFRPLSHLYTDITFMVPTVIDGGIRDRLGIVFNLDYCLELDHNPDNSESRKHRVQNYLEIFNVSDVSDVEWKTDKLSFKSLYSKIDLDDDKSMKKIALQLRGSSQVKTLPHNYMKQLASKLAEKYQVILLDYDKNYGFNGTNIINACGKLDIYECVALLSKMECCICMDSGILWLAHSANCPVVTILGPTRESERLSLHPLYPDKARSINIAKDMIGCEPCFETRENCKGAINCMRNFNWEELNSKIFEQLNLILGE